MSIERQTLFWLGAAATLVFLLVLLGDILLPFVLGAAVAYFLDPIADRLERAGFSRLWATISIMLVFGIIILSGLVFLFPPLLEQMAGLAARLPSYIQSVRDIAVSFAERHLGDFFGAGNDQVEGAVANLIEKATGWTGRLVGSVWSGGMALVNTLALFLVTPIVLFYLLRDWDQMIARIDQWLPREHAETVRTLAREIDEVLAGFVRGQVTVLLILGFIYVVGLTLIGLNFGLLIGVTAGLISFIPYIGPIVGLLIGGTVAIVQFGATDWVPIAAVFAVFLVGQAIEGNILSPMIVGDRVRLHPMWLIFALFVFAFLFGFVGMLLAVPAAAAIGVLVRFALRKYLESPLYSGKTGRSVRPARVSRAGRKKG